MADKVYPRSCKTVEGKISSQDVIPDCVWNTLFHGGKDLEWEVGFNPLDDSDKDAVVFLYVALAIIYFDTLILLHLILVVNKLALNFIVS